MTTIKEDELCICLADSEPAQRRELLIKAIAAAMRWFGGVADNYDKDGENIYVLSQLLEELVIIN